MVEMNFGGAVSSFRTLVPDNEAGLKLVQLCVQRPKGRGARTPATRTISTAETVPTDTIASASEGGIDLSGGPKALVI